MTQDPSISLVFCIPQNHSVTGSIHGLGTEVKIGGQERKRGRKEGQDEEEVKWQTVHRNCALKVAQSSHPIFPPKFY